jgi:CRISPR/Cas system-associated exonuclease Cas4 (RecB family)
MIHIIESPTASVRLAAAAEFLAAIPAGTEALVVAASRGAADDLVRRLAANRHATFGLHRFSLAQLAGRLAAPDLAARRLAPCTRLGAEAVAARAAFDALSRNALPSFQAIARCPGFGPTLAATLTELRAADIDPARLAALGPPADELAWLAAAYEAELAGAGLADRSAVLRLATDAIRSDPLTALPMVLLDLGIENRVERDFVAALCGAAPRGIATVASGDMRTAAALRSIEAAARSSAAAATLRSSLGRLQTHLFDAESPGGTVDDSVRFFSAPGEARETVEIARRVLAEARAGTALDHIHIFLRSPETYSALLETAFERAGIPAYFTRGTQRPDPSGRALLALLDCAAEGLSAVRFAEYLSFGQVPSEIRDAEGAPWAGPRDELLGAASAGPSGGVENSGAPDDADESAPAMPWKWEALLVDAAVIGGAERWQRRLDGLDRELALRAAELANEDPDAARLASLARTRAQLARLRGFALPVIERLAALPQRALWGEWLAHLRALAPAVLRVPHHVLEVLAELVPMTAVGPVEISEARAVLAERLRSVTEEPPESRYGRVLVGTLEEARGRSAEIVFIPGLAERVFPRRPVEDPLLLDALREQLDADLPTQNERGQRERLLLRLGVGAAERRLHLSYPRLDIVQGRPRVTSFYGLDVARAVLGRIPDVEAFQRDAEAAAGAHLAWPAPADPAEAIDASEHDLAVLGRLLGAPPGAREKGGAQYLLELNGHLGRSLRTRYMRWERAQWTEHDGIIDTPVAAPFLAAHRLTARPYSPSALQQFAVCPYRFFLAAMHRLEPRPEIGRLEQLDPLTRGTIVHRTQAETLRALVGAGALPLTVETLAQAEEVLQATLGAVAAQYAEELAPPIPRIWDDEIAAMRGDLIHWLRHLAAHGAEWQPAYVELGFGMAADAAYDPHSRREPVVLANGVALRGAVDLVERRAGSNAVRVTDHKTGSDRTPHGLVIGKGEVLQPVLYGLAVEAALAVPVVEGRLFFCTSRGGFAEHAVRLDATAKHEALAALDTIDRAIGTGFLPPAPRADACARCDFRMVCGPYEAERWKTHKDPARLAPLQALRERP